MTFASYILFLFIARRCGEQSRCHRKILLDTANRTEVRAISLLSLDRTARHVIGRRWKARFQRPRYLTVAFGVRLVRAKGNWLKVVSFGSFVLDLIWSLLFFLTAFAFCPSNYVLLNLYNVKAQTTMYRGKIKLHRFVRYFEADEFLCDILFRL